VAEKSNQTTEALSLTLVKNFTVAILFDKWKYPKKKKGMESNCMTQKL